MTVETVNGLKQVTADTNKILTLPDGAICVFCLVPTAFDTTTIVESDYVVEEIEPTEVEKINGKISNLADVVVDMTMQILGV